MITPCHAYKLNWKNWLKVRDQLQMTQHCQSFLTSRGNRRHKINRPVPTALCASIISPGLFVRSSFVVKHENGKRMCMICVLREYRIQ
jgi:hypothetical protein